MIRLTVPALGEEEIEAAASVMRSGYLVQGQQVLEFERLVAEYVGVDHAVAVSSGTAALHLALVALDIGPDDEVIVPDFTFPACANVVELTGARPTLVDIDLATFNVDAQRIPAAITDRTRAIMPVHLFGQSADMDPVMRVARERGLPVIEDAACALGTEYHGRRCGQIGDIACLSFHPRKIITTGEGGMVLTNDGALAQRVRELRNHGMRTTHGRIGFELAGFNYRLTDFQGAIGVVQMKRLEQLIATRTELAEAYDRELAGLSFITRPAVMDDTRHIWQAYVVLIDAPLPRDEVIRRLREQGVEAGIGTYAVSAQPHYARSTNPLPNSGRAYEHGLCLPLHPCMSAADVREVARCLERVAR